MNTILLGDVRAMLPTLEAESVQCCVTSPPYFGLRDYGVDGQIGLEARPDCLGWATGAPCGECFICIMVDTFREVWRVLKPDGTLWMNMGDSYASTGGQSLIQAGEAFKGRARQRDSICGIARSAGHGLKPKDLMGIPWRLALALQADGWYLRQDIIWAKPNPMPESAKDRCTKAHEYLFLLAKQRHYYFDAKAIEEPAVAAAEAKWAGTESGLHSGGAHPGESTRRFRKVTPAGWDQGAGSHGTIHRDGAARGTKAKGNRKTFRGGGVYTAGQSFDNDADVANDSIGNAPNDGMTRNKRSVWTIPSKPFAQAHFATFPPALVQPCVLAGSRPGDLVLDPFMGAGTTAVVCEALGRQWVGCELNPEYRDLALRRIHHTQGGLGF